MEFLNKEQLYFVETMIDNINNDRYGRYLLKAPGGTGKSYCTSFIIKNIKNKSVIIAPTHQAKKVLIKNGNRTATTIHRFLNAKHDYDKNGNTIFEFKPKSLKGYVIFIDECSMMTIEIYDIIVNQYSHDNIIIFCGDHLQLPPIENQNDLDDNEIEEDATEQLSKVSRSFSVKPEFTLSVNMRTNNEVSSLVVENARKSVENGVIPDNIVPCSISDLLNHYKNSNSSCVTLAYSNPMVKYYNDLIRAHLFSDGNIKNLEEYYVGEKLVFTGTRRLVSFSETNEPPEVYNTSDVITIKKLEQEEMTLQYHKCECMKLNTDKKKCNDCGIPGNNSNGELTINFWKITDDHDTIWYKPYSDIDKKQLNKLNKVHLGYCKKQRKPRYWSSYYSFKHTYNANLRYSYACTIHKSQGSEWDCVFVDRQNLIKCVRNDQLLKLNAYYTAISRMKTEVHEIVYESVCNSNYDMTGNVMKFGKHQGKSYDWVILFDNNYCKWINEVDNPSRIMRHFREYYYRQNREPEYQIDYVFDD